MSVFKFACPHCDQHIEAEDSYAGVRIQCPRCQQEMVIPGPAQPVAAQPPSASSGQAPAPPAPAPAAGGAPLRVSLRTSHASTPAPAPEPAPAPAPGAMHRPAMTSVPIRQASDEEAGRGGSKVGRIVLIAALVLIAPVALYYAFQWAGRAQKGFNEARAKDEDPGVIGGQLSHIAELNRVLDMTDRMTGTAPERPSQRDAARGAAAAAAKVITPATWTLELEKAQIPGGMVAGSFGTSNFVARSVVLYTGAAAPILALRSGDGPSVEQELLIYLPLKRGEKLEGRSWSLAKDQPAGTAQVIKRWRVNPRLAPQQKAFQSGYAMKLEFGQPADGELPGKIYLALPDAEQTVAGGVFAAEIRVIETTPAGQQRGSRESSFDE